MEHNYENKESKKDIKMFREKHDCKHYVRSYNQNNVLQVEVIDIQNQSSFMLENRVR